MQCLNSLKGFRNRVLNLKQVKQKLKYKKIKKLKQKI